MVSFPHIIILETEEALSYLLEAIIRTLYPTARVSLVENSTTALQVYEQSGSDLLITKHNPPLDDGLELTRTLRATGALLPIIIMSADPDAEQEALEAGATLFLKKPGMMRALRTMLPTLLPP